MQGEALLKIGGILEKMSNDISILKSNSIGGSTNYSGSIKPITLQKTRSRSRSIVRKQSNKRPILRSTSQRRKTIRRPISLKRKNSNKKNTKRKK